MNKIKLGFVIGSLAVITGCSTVPLSEPAYRDNEPNLVGKPIAERINESQISINDQFALLERIHSGKHVGTYNVVEHNNNLDARKGSDYTVPYDYAHNTYDIPGQKDKRFTVVDGKSSGIVSTNVSRNNETEVMSVTVVSDELKQIELPVNSTTSQKVKKIDWQNNSLNILAENLAKALGYELVIQSGSIADKNITFVAEDNTLLEVVNSLIEKTANFADIVVIAENKTFNVFYK